MNNELGGGGCQTEVIDCSVSLIASRQCHGLSSTVHRLFCYFSPSAVIALRLCSLLGLTAERLLLAEPKWRVAFFWCQSGSLMHEKAWWDDQTSTCPSVPTPSLSSGLMQTQAPQLHSDGRGQISLSAAGHGKQSTAAGGQLWEAVQTVTVGINANEQSPIEFHF